MCSNFYAYRIPNLVLNGMDLDMWRIAKPNDSTTMPLLMIFMELIQPIRLVFTIGLNTASQVEGYFSIIGNMLTDTIYNTIPPIHMVSPLMNFLSVGKNKDWI